MPLDDKDPKDKISDEEIEKLREELIKNGIGNIDIIKNNKKPKFKDRFKKIIIRFLIDLFFAGLLFLINLATFGFLSNYIEIDNYKHALYYILLLTVGTQIFDSLFRFLYLIPGMYLGLRPYILQLLKPVLVFIVLLMLNFNIDWVHFIHWYDIIVFLFISYIFQFAITYYRFKNKIRKII